MHNTTLSMAGNSLVTNYYGNNRHAFALASNIHLT